MQNADLLADRRHGQDNRDSSLDGLLQKQSSAVQERFKAETSYYYDWEGWRFILPELPADATVLCIDARFGTTSAVFARSAKSVTVAHPDKTTLQLTEQRLRELGIHNVQYRTLDASSALPFADASFDAVIVHDVNGLLVSTDHGDARLTFSTEFLRDTRRVLKKNGFVYFGLKNAWGYDRLLSRGTTNHFQQGPGVSTLSARRLSRRAGFRASRVYPYLLENSLVCEVLPHTGYASSKNSFTFKERIKEILLSRFSAPLLTPAFGMICYPERPRPGRFQLLARQLAESKLITPSNDSRFRRYLALPGKVVISLGPTQPLAERRVVVLPLMSKYVAWRRREIETIAALQKLPATISDRVPAIYKEFSFSGEPGFVISEIPGMTIDRIVPRLNELTHSAVEFLIDFHRVTARTAVVDDATYASLCTDIFDNARRLYPAFKTNFDRLDGLLKQRLSGKTLPLVWAHGDFKLENLMLHKRNFKVLGVIDWEQSRQSSFPLLDLYYLLTYNHMMRSNDDFLDVYQRLNAPGGYQDEEQKTMARYCSTIGIPPAMVPLLWQLYFLHHIACRYVYDLHKEHDRSRISRILDTIERTS